MSDSSPSLSEATLQTAEPRGRFGLLKSPNDSLLPNCPRTDELQQEDFGRRNSFGASTGLPALRVNRVAKDHYPEEFPRLGVVRAEPCCGGFPLTHEFLSVTLGVRRAKRGLTTTSVGTAQGTLGHAKLCETCDLGWSGHGIHVKCRKCVFRNPWN